MTKEEALKIWLPVIKMGVEPMPECNEALDMAIKALEQEPKMGQWTIKQYQVPIKNKQVPTVSSMTFPAKPTACKIVYTYTHSDCKSDEYLNKYNYCPNCGAKMEGLEE